MRQTTTPTLHQGRVNFAKCYPGFSVPIHLTPFKELSPFFPFTCELFTGKITSYGDSILTQFCRWLFVFKQKAQLRCIKYFSTCSGFLTIFAAGLTKEPKILNEFARPQDQRLVLHRSQFVGVLLFLYFVPAVPAHSSPCHCMLEHKVSQEIFPFYVTSLCN